MANTLDELGLGAPVDVAEWSYGALVSLDFALDHAGRVPTLTLIEPPALWVLRALAASDTEARRVEAMVRTLHGDPSDDQLERFVRTVGLCPPGESPRALSQWAEWGLYRRSLRHACAVAEHSDDPRRLTTLARPVLLVKGSGSAGLLHRIIDLLQAQLPDARLPEIPGGHAPHIVSRARFLRELSMFHSGPQP